MKSQVKLICLTAIFITVSLIIFLNIKQNSNHTDLDQHEYPIYRDMMHDISYNVYDVIKAGNRYFEYHDKGKGSGYKQFQRWIIENEDVYYPSGDRTNFNPLLPYEVRGMYETGHFEPSDEATFLRASFEVVGDANWEEIGPSVELKSAYSEKRNGNGRVDAVWINPNDANHIYVGNRGGGLWITENGGLTWEPKTDFLGINGVNSIAVNPNNTNEIYIATAIAGKFSIGIFKSTDGGNTWSPTGYALDIAQDFTTVMKVLMDPSNPQVLFAATTKGLIKSSDGFQTWSKVLDGNIVDAELKPGNGSVVYAVNDDDSTLYKSIDGGTTFNSTGAIAIGNNQIAVTMAAPSNVYMVGDNRFLKSTDDAQTFVQGGSPDGGTRNYGGFAVSDTDPDLIINGSLDTWLSTDGGTTFSEVTNWIYNQSTGIGGNFIHADIREIEVLNGDIYIGSDGWLVKSTDGGYNYDILTFNMGNHEIYEHGLGVSQAAPNTLIVGVQDNGTSVLYEGVWHHWKGGDGGTSVADYSNKDIFYGSLYNGDFKRTDTAGKTSDWIDLGDTKPGSLPPLVQHPTEPGTIFLGEGNGQIWKSTDRGNTWAIIANLGVADVVDEMAIAPSNALIIYASIKNQIWTSIDGGNNWTEITNGTPDLVVKGIAIDYNDPNHVAITYSGYTAGEKAYETNNGGVTWTNISAGLPNLPNHDIIFENSAVDGLYLASDVGVYFRDNNAVGWNLYATGLPNSRVNDMEIQHATGKLYVATWGRGVWSVDLMNPNLTPLADFTVSATEIYKGETVDFTDNSLNDPVSWMWSFPGATPSTSTLQNPSVIYNTPGLYTVTLTVTNANGTAIQEKQNIINVTGEANQDPALEVYYPFDNSIADYSNYGRHGSANGSELYETGVKGNAFTFDSSNTVSAFQYSGILGDNTRSVALWLKTNADGSLANWGSSGTAKRFTFRLDGGKLRVEIAGSYVVATTNVADGEWHHVAITFSNDNVPTLQNINFYVDGQVDSVSSIGNLINVNTGEGGDVLIGSYPFGDNLIGAIDDFRMYSKTLTAQEVTSLSDPRIDGLISKYDFNQNLTDEGSNEIDATANYSQVIYTSNNDGDLLTAYQAPTSQGQYLTIPSYKGITGNNSRTVTAWIKTDEAGTRKTVISWGTNSSGQMFNVMVENNNVRIEGGVSSLRTTEATIEDNNWHHIAYTFESANGTGSLADGQIYIDGVLQTAVSAFNGSTVLNTTTNDDVRIGDAAYNTNFFYRGDLDDVRIYDRALDVNEILTIIGTEFRGLVSSYEFDGNLLDDGDNAIEAQSNYGMPTYINDRNGTVQSAIQTTGIDSQYLTIPDYKGIEGDQARTVTAWVKTTDEGDRKTILGWGTNASGGMFNLMVQNNNVRIEGGVSSFLSVDGTIEDNRWHHIAYTFNPEDGDGSLASGKIYIDGQFQVNTTSFNGITALNTIANEDVRIGSAQYNPNHFFTGSLDQVQIYNVALSLEEIVELVGDLPNPEPEFDLTAQFLFEGNLQDISQYGRDAVSGGSESYIVGPFGAGQAYELTGDNWLTIPGYNGEIFSRDRSVAAWIKTTDKNKVIVNWGAPVTSQKITFKTHTNGNLRVEVAGGYIIGFTNVADGQWHHVVFTFLEDTTPDVTDIKLYVDGQNDPISASLGRTINTIADGDVQIGQDTFGNGMVGSIDDVRIYSIALTEAEIAGLAIPQATGLISDFKFGNDLSNAGTLGIDAESTFGTPSFSTDKNNNGSEAWLAPQLDGQSLTISNFKGITGTNSRTVSAWVNVESGGSRKTILSWGVNEPEKMFNIMVLDGEVRVEAGASNIMSSGANLEDGKWHLVAYTFDEADGGKLSDGKIYVDGNLITELTNFNGQQLINTAYGEDVLLGGAIYRTDYYFRGLLDDVRIYDYVLTAGDLRNQFCEISGHIEIVLSQEKEKVYFGYTEAYNCTTLTLESLIGGHGDLTFEWNTGETSEIITVCPEVTTTYSLTATDSYGCQIAEAFVTVEVEDVRCGNNLEKIVVCHKGNNVLCVEYQSVADHLNHGDQLGYCQSPMSANKSFEEMDISYTRRNNQLIIKSNTLNTGTAEIYTLKGFKVDHLKINKGEHLTKELSNGIYILKITIDDKTQIKKVLFY